MATIFISHSSRDETLTCALLAWLRANGFDDLFIDQEHIVLGDKWTEALRRAEGACRVVLCLVTPSWLASDECFGEFMAGWYAGRRIIPLFALGVATLDERQRGRLGRVMHEDQGVDISRAGAPDALDLDAQPAVATALKGGLRAAGAMSRIGLDPYAFEIDRRARTEPYPGLASFDDTDADAAIFFGRSQEISRCLEDLREIRAKGDKRAYLILGASGSGKSSLLKAGLLPRLRRERGWFVLRAFRPGGDPLYNFADAIARSGQAVKVTMAPGTIRDDLRAAWLAHADLREKLDSIVGPFKLKDNRDGATTLIAIDQAEELARANGESAEVLCAYLKAVLAPVAQGLASPFALTLTLRSDSLRELETAPALEGLETRAQHVRALPVHRIGATIEQPAARYGVEVEAPLVDALIDDADRQDALPLLAFTLQRLWRHYASEKCIRKAHYDALGKLSGLIEDAAERALRGLDPIAHQVTPIGTMPAGRDARAARVFVPSLAQLNERGSPVRRVASLSSFDDDAQSLLNDFVNWRLAVRSDDAIEVAHEAMFREWPRFKGWLDTEKGRLEALRGVESAAASWAANARQREYLIHRGKRLSQARALDRFPDYRRQLSGNSESRNYLDRCVAAARRRLVITSGVVSAFAVVVLLIVFIPEFVRRQAAAAAAMEHQAAVAAAEHYVSSAKVLSTAADEAALKPGDAFRDCADCPEMVVIPAGRFLMGSATNEANRGDDEGPQHRVTLPAFAAGKFSVTFAEWDACAVGGGCQGNTRPKDNDEPRGRRPVTDVSWNDAQEYAQWISRRTGKQYRLLSEAEWEYAARGGTTTPYYTGASIGPAQANFGSNIGAPEPVGAYPPNPFGLHDVAGNAWQWVEDCFNGSTYEGAPADGSAWISGDCSRRMVRGGSWYTEGARIRHAKRDAYLRTTRLTNGGLRLARNVSQEAK